MAVDRPGFSFQSSEIGNVIAGAADVLHVVLRFFEDAGVSREYIVGAMDAVIRDAQRITGDENTARALLAKMLKDSMGKPLGHMFQLTVIEGGKAAPAPGDDAP